MKEARELSSSPPKGRETSATGTIPGKDHAPRHPEAKRLRFQVLRGAAFPWGIRTRKRRTLHTGSRVFTILFP
jgi:hypothetical protein